ncbi:putative RiPP precursor [Aquamicrobium soli]|uniref:RiPP n=1 Tax=Aquamicrobium soli TaxID=1811518 RepID=A0ABV7K3T5_9HYPH
MKKKTYEKPVLQKREKLGAVTAAPAGSGVRET